MATIVNQAPTAAGASHYLYIDLPNATADSAKQKISRGKQLTRSLISGARQNIAQSFKQALYVQKQTHPASSD